MIEISGAKPKTVPFKWIYEGKHHFRYEYDFEAFEWALNSKTKCVLITNPHNPTGKVLSKSDIEIIT